MEAMTTDYEPIRKLTKDLREGVRLTPDDARFFVDLYYQIQDVRIRANGQRRQSSEAAEPHALVAWLSENAELLERNIQRALGWYAQEHRPGRWALSICGIGPVLASGLLANIDIEKAPTVGHIWRFAGLDPTVTWGKGEKRPFNAKLKVLCWKISDSFVKQSGRDSDIYGKVYRERKALECERDAAGAFSETAEKTLANRKIRDAATRAVYESGRLPAGRLDLRARRYAVKLFLSHFHHVSFESRFGTPPPKPYIIQHGGHTHFVSPPQWPCE